MKKAVKITMILIYIAVIFTAISCSGGEESDEKQAENGEVDTSSDEADTSKEEASKEKEKKKEDDGKWGPVKGFKYAFASYGEHPGHFLVGQSTSQASFILVIWLTLIFLSFQSFKLRKVWRWWYLGVFYLIPRIFIWFLCEFPESAWGKEGLESVESMLGYANFLYLVPVGFSAVWLWRLKKAYNRSGKLGLKAFFWNIQLASIIPPPYVEEEDELEEEPSEEEEEGEEEEETVEETPEEEPEEEDEPEPEKDVADMGDLFKFRVRL